jgi:hypothetical protein
MELDREESIQAIIDAVELVQNIQSRTTNDGGDIMNLSLQEAVAMVSTRDARITRDAINIGITRGIAWAMGFIAGSYDMPTIAQAMARNAGIKSIEELKENGVDQFDIDKIGDIW